MKKRQFAEAASVPKPKRARRRTELELLVDTRGPPPLYRIRRPAGQFITKPGRIAWHRRSTDSIDTYQPIERTAKSERAGRERSDAESLTVGKGQQNNVGGKKVASLELDVDGSSVGVGSGTVKGQGPGDLFRGGVELGDPPEGAAEPDETDSSSSRQEKSVTKRRSSIPEQAQPTKRQQANEVAIRGSFSSDELQESLQGSPPRTISRAHDLVPETETDTFPSNSHNRKSSSAKRPPLPTLKREERHLTSEDISQSSESQSSPDASMFFDLALPRPTEQANAASLETDSTDAKRRRVQNIDEIIGPDPPKHAFLPHIRSCSKERTRSRRILISDKAQLSKNPSASVIPLPSGTATDGEPKRYEESSPGQLQEVSSNIAVAPNSVITDGLAQGSTPLRLSTTDILRQSLSGIRTDLASGRTYTLKPLPGTPGSLGPPSRPPTPPPQADIDPGSATHCHLESPLRTVVSADDDAMLDLESPSAQQEDDDIPGTSSSRKDGFHDSIEEEEQLNSGSVRVPFADMGQEQQPVAGEAVAGSPEIPNPFSSGCSAPNPFQSFSESPKPVYNPFQATSNPFSAPIRQDTPFITHGGPTPFPSATPALINARDDPQPLSSPQPLLSSQPLRSSQPQPPSGHGGLSVQFHPLRGFTVGIALDQDNPAADAKSAEPSSTLPSRILDTSVADTRAPLSSSSWTNLKVPASGAQLARPRPEADHEGTIPLRPLVGRRSTAEGGGDVEEETSMETSEASFGAKEVEEDEEEKACDVEMEDEASLGDAGWAEETQYADSGGEDHYEDDYVDVDADMYSTGDEQPDDSYTADRHVSDGEPQQQEQRSQGQTGQLSDRPNDTDAQMDDQDDDEYIIPYDPASPLIDKPSLPPSARRTSPTTTPSVWSGGIPGLTYSKPPTEAAAAPTEGAASTGMPSLPSPQPSSETPSLTRATERPATIGRSSSVGVGTPASESWTARGDAAIVDPTGGDANDEGKLDDEEMEDLFGSDE